MRATRIVGCIIDTLWRNKTIGIDTKSRIYVTYTAETRPDIATKELMKKMREMRIFRRIIGKTL